jgi:diguanylate cyclase (GGDEF)-like protein/PAS domain S-box-containing protein
MIAISQDVLNQKKIHQMQDYLCSNLIKSISYSTNFNNALILTGKQICELNDWDYGEVWIPDHTGAYLKCSQAVFGQRFPAIAQFRTQSLKFIFTRNIGLPGRLWVSKKMQWYADVTQLSKQVFPRLELAQQVGIKNGFGIPIVIDNHVVAIFLFFMFKSIPEPPSNLEFIQKVLPQVSALLHQKQIQQKLQDANEKYRSIFENAVEGIFQTTADGRYLIVNPMLAKIYGYDSPEEMMANITDIEHQLYVDPQRRREFRRLLEKQDAVWEFESKIYRKDGKIIWISECARRLRNGSGEVIGYEGTVIDITERKQAELELLKRDYLLEAVAQAMNELLLNQNHQEAVIAALGKLGMAVGVHRVYVCIETEQIHPISDRTTEVTDDQTVNRPRLEMAYEWTANGFKSAKTAESIIIPVNSQIFSRLLKGESVAVLMNEMNSDDRRVFGYADVMSNLLVPILAQEEFFGYVGFDDCKNARSWSKSEESILVAIAGSIGGAIQRHHQEALIHHQAFHDRLTGLGNRQLLEKCLPQILTNAQQQEQKVALMFVDLDRFKIINDTLGHPVGDRLLQIAAERLQHSIREHDLIVRWGGDEFIIILTEINSEADVSHIAHRIIASMQQTFEITKHQLYISCSIGIGLYPQDGVNSAILMQNADVALYRVKETSRNGYEFYSPYMNSQISQKTLLQSSANDALKKQEFLLYYQPLINAETRRIIGMESLVRWEHPELGLLPAEKFIPLLEEDSVILKLGQWVLHTACAQTYVWQSLGVSPLRIWVNLSTLEFQQENLLEMITHILHETGMNPQFLGLEINEKTAMTDLEFTHQRMQQLQELGISLTLDNFGSGFVSLNALKILPFNHLKLARSFVQNLATNPQEVALIRTMIDLGHQFCFQVIVQGIETPWQKEVVLTLDCDYIQGELFSPPLFANHATRLLQLPI